jgi:hypothetical protein
MLSAPGDWVEEIGRGDWIEVVATRARSMRATKAMS